MTLGLPRKSGKAATLGLVALGLALALALALGGAARAADPRCGNGVVETGEACDLGIGNEVGRRCTARCVEPRCGDGELDVDEACDDGNLVDRDGCSAACIDEQQPRWRSTFDGGAPLGEQFAAVALTPEGPVAVGSTATDIFETMPVVVGFDHDGQRRFADVLWSGPGFGTANAVATVPEEGGVVVVGALANLDGRVHPMAWRYEADGARRYATALPLWAVTGSVTTVAAVSSSQAFVAGIHDPLVGGETGWIGELDPRDGELTWSVPLEGGRRVTDLVLAPDEYLVAVGHLGNVTPRMWLGAFELDGTPRWIQDLPSHEDGMPDAATSVVVAADGSIYATGYAAFGWVDETSSYDIDVWLGAFDPDGMQRWERLQPGTLGWSDQGNDVVLDPQDRPLVVGTLQTQALAASTYFDRDAWLRQYDVDGEEVWTWAYDGPLHTGDTGSAAAFTEDGALIVVGSTAERRKGDDGFVLELLVPSNGLGRSGAASPPRMLAVREHEPLALYERGPHRATLQLEFDGGTLRPGDRGSLLEVPCLQSEAPYPGLALDEQSVQAVVDRVAMAMSPYGVRVRTDDEPLPPHLPRTTVLVGGLAEQIGLDAATAGYACVVDCGDRWSWDLAFAFARDLPSIANNVLHEAAHTWGLDHVASQDLLMYPLGATYDAGWGMGCVEVSDQTSAPQCLEQHERWCPPGQQDSHTELLATFGPAVLDVEPPRVEIVEPPTGQRLAPGEPLALELRVEDDDGDPGHRVVVPELEWERVAYGDETTLSLALPPGTFTVRVEAIDHAGNESIAAIEVVVGDPSPPRVPPGEGDDDVVDDDDPRDQRLDDGCRVGGHPARSSVAMLLVLLVLGSRSRRARRGLQARAGVLKCRRGRSAPVRAQ